ncbi:RICIN domain-containing protein [Streptomyces albireticuli]|uniref:RICIN domain-containing protein n=1 Tax=Streptomyces albireticuli TaxID=1940 RepID=UPI001473BB59|nr:RICIN domain-containing protein [Streptomyces albireticuli]MCD9140868.1 RICIN domain-containing protein [Streptomyces albireticuli]MCD9161170.1 RICIN domain-containing protein [Streptomyces albireticuli]MCD9190772.1 RICIN domain-containing protein [Streptomyces albireticuli]
MKNVKKRALAYLAAVGVVVPLAVVGASGEASARDGEEVTWKNVATKRCLTSDGYHDVETLPAKDCRFGYRWTEHAIREDSSGNGVYRFSTKNGKVCLDSSDGGKVYLKPCNSGKYQMWMVTKVLGTWKIVNVATSMALDSSDGGKVYTKPINTGSYQRWT